MVTDFGARMRNSWHFSNCNDPCSPITPGRTEIIVVDLNGDLLTVASAQHATLRKRRIYATRAVDADALTVFVVLAEPPPLISDPAFFPAAGTIILFSPVFAGQRRLRAVGTDLNSGVCRGWIFDAIELGNVKPAPARSRNNG